MTKTTETRTTSAAEILLKDFTHTESPIDGVEVVASTSQQVEAIKEEIKQLNIKSIRMMYSVLKGYGFAVGFSKSLFSTDLEGDDFKLMLKPFRGLQAVLGVYGCLRRKAEAAETEEDVRAMKRAKSACFDELKALKRWLGVDEHCKATDIDTLEAHCFKYSRKNRENIAEGWIVKPSSVYQFINFIFKELNFGDSRTECVNILAEKALKQGLIETPQVGSIEEKPAQKKESTPKKSAPKEAKAEA